jgi:hypothetical protein
MLDSVGFLTILVACAAATVVGLILVCAMGSFQQIDLRYVKDLHEIAMKYADQRIEGIKEEIRELWDKVGRDDTDTESGDEETETEEGRPMMLKVDDWSIEDIQEAIRQYAKEKGMIPTGYEAGEVTIEVLDSDGEEVEYDEIGITLFLEPAETVQGGG